MSAILSDVDRRIAALPKAEQAPRRELLSRVAEAIVEKPLAELGPLVDELIGASGHGEAAENWSLAEARTRNLLRVLEDQARVINESVSGATVRDGLGVSRQRLHQLVIQGRLIAIRIQDGGPYHFPFWQFTAGAPVRPVDGLSRLIDAAREAEMEPLVLHFFMIEPNDRLGGRAPCELLAAGEIDPVIEVLLSSGLGPF